MKKIIFTLLISLTSLSMNVNSQTVLTHSSSEIIDPGMRYLCMYKYYSSWSGLTYVYYQFKQRYQRVFDMSALGLTDTVDAIGLQIGILETRSPVGTQTLNANVYTLSGSFIYANMTQVATGSTDVGVFLDSMVYIPLQGRIPGSSLAIAEFEIPQGSFYDSVRCFAGFNGLPQTDKTYHSAFAWSTWYGCYYNDPIDFASLGAPYTNYHIIMNLLVNQKPTNGDVNVTTLRDSAYTFDVSVFAPSFSDADADAIEKIKITSLPDYGWLKFKGDYVLPGDTMLGSDLDQLVYEPTRAYVGWDRLTYVASDGVAWANEEAEIIINVLKPGVGIEDVEFANNVNLYPNPVADFFNVAIENDSEETISVAIYNMLGQEVVNQYASDMKKVMIDASTLAAGMYNVHIMQGDRVTTKAIIKN